MTPKEKAEELINTYYEIGFPIQLDRLINLEYEMNNAKQCALIAVDEILKANVFWYKNSVPHKYYTNVKKEIQKL